MYCSNCGTEFTENQNFCKNCGNRVQNIYASNIYRQNYAVNTQPYAPGIIKPIRATGFLQVWLYIVTIFNACLFFYYIVNAIIYFYGAYFYGALYSTALIIGAIFLLLGHKIGYYIICASVLVNVIFYLVLYYYLPPSAVGSIFFPILLWLALKNQWNNFR